MPLMMEKLYDALKAGGIPDDLAHAAAVEAAQHETRFTALEARMTVLEGRMAALETRMAALEGRMTTLMWVVGINTAVMLGMLARLFTLH